MHVDPATFLGAVYLVVDTAWQALPPEASPPHPGPTQVMSDSEIVTLLILRHFSGVSERGILRWAATTGRAAFPQLLSQSAFNRRARRVARRLPEVMTWLAVKLEVARDTYEILDGLPIPVARRCRGERRRRFTPEEAGVGRGGVGNGWYYGVTVMLSVAASGPITGLTVAPAQTGERWACSALLSHRHNPTALPQTAAALASRGARTDRYVGPIGPIAPLVIGHSIDQYYLADRGFAGAAWHAHWQEDLGATVVTPLQVAPGVRHWFSHARQIIETVHAQLTGPLHIRYPLAHTHQGLLTRILTTCVAFNVGLLINRLLHRPAFAIGTLCNL